MALEERQPLLGQDRQAHDGNQDLERGGLGGDDERRLGVGEEEEAGSWREQVAEKLESKALHKAVITLVRPFVSLSPEDVLITKYNTYIAFDIAQIRLDVYAPFVLRNFGDGTN